MYIYLDESRVAFHLLSSNVAGQLFEIAYGQKVNFVGSLSLWFRVYGLRAKPRTLYCQFLLFVCSLIFIVYRYGTGLSPEPLPIHFDDIFGALCTVSVI